MKIRIKLTEPQSEIWNWAQDAAREYWHDDYARDDRMHFDECPVGEAKDGFAEIENMIDPISDMIYRIGDQLIDMANEQGGYDQHGRADKERMDAISIIPVANRIVKKLKTLISLQEG